MPVANLFGMFRDISNGDGSLSVPVRKREFKKEEGRR